MHFDVMDLDRRYWATMMNSFWGYSAEVDKSYVYQNTATSKEYSRMYCSL